MEKQIPGQAACKLIAKKFKSEVSMLCSCFLAFALLFYCESIRGQGQPTNGDSLTIDHADTGSGAYFAGQEVSASFRLLNDRDQPIHLTEVLLTLIDLTEKTCPIIFKKSIESDLALQPHASHKFLIPDFYRVAADSKGSKAYALYIQCCSLEYPTQVLPASFFRVVDDKTLLTYDVNHIQFKGLDVFTLSGGMSAEYGVEKSLASLSCGISHMWYCDNALGGPAPVFATPDFLRMSLKKTVDLYENLIGRNTKVRTVIIGSGVPSVAYLSTTMSAVYLPIHFLVSANSAFEVESIVKRSGELGYSVYATLGHDGSMPTVGVAWIKLLDLPQEYKEFLINHQVEQVILYGVGENVYGESRAQKIISRNVTGKYSPGSVYVLFPGGGSSSDEEALSMRIHDFKSLKLDAGQNIADWESAITSDQINNFSKSIKSVGGVNPYSITDEGDMINMYDIGSDLVVSYIKKNENRLSSPYVKGVAFNEYLVSHPQFEIYSGYVPLLYWQLVPAVGTVDRCFGAIRKAVGSEYPDVASQWSMQTFCLNSNYGKDSLEHALNAQGVSSDRIIKSARGQDVWNPSAGMNAPCELNAAQIVNEIGVSNYVAKLKSLVPLSITDVQSVCMRNSGLIFSTY